MRYSEMKARENERDFSAARRNIEQGDGTRPVPWLLLLVVAAGLVVMLMGCSSAEYRDKGVEITTTGPVDLERYQGRWYEIARFPNRFEEGCVGVTADYSLNADGSVKVVNTCRQGTLDGPVETAEGRATAASPDNDRLRVNFVSWLPFAAGDYWILDLDEDYSVVVVGNPSGTTGWVLARDPSIPEAMLEAAYDVLRRNGYDTAQMTLTPQ